MKAKSSLKTKRWPWTVLKTVLAQNAVTPIGSGRRTESIEEERVFQPLWKCQTSSSWTFICRRFGFLRSLNMSISKRPSSSPRLYDVNMRCRRSRWNSIDYLLKPVTVSALERALNKLRHFNLEEREAHIQNTNDAFHPKNNLKSLLIMLLISSIRFLWRISTISTRCRRRWPLIRPTASSIPWIVRSMRWVNNLIRSFFRANRQFIISRKAIKDVDLWFGSRLAVNLVLPVPERIVISKIKSPFF